MAQRLLACCRPIAADASLISIGANTRDRTPDRLIHGPFDQEHFCEETRSVAATETMLAGARSVSTSKCRSYGSNCTDTAFVSNLPRDPRHGIRGHMRPRSRLDWRPARIKLRNFITPGRDHLAKSLVDHPRMFQSCALTNENHSSETSLNCGQQRRGGPSSIYFRKA